MKYKYPVCHKNKSTVSQISIKIRMKWFFFFQCARLTNKRTNKSKYPKHAQYCHSVIPQIPSSIRIEDSSFYGLIDECVLVLFRIKAVNRFHSNITDAVDNIIFLYSFTQSIYLQVPHNICLSLNQQQVTWSV